MIAHAADRLWRRAGAPLSDVGARREHRLALHLLHLQREIELLTSHGNMPAVATTPMVATPYVPPPAPDRQLQADGEMARDGVGFRRLRSCFVSSDECALLRSAMTLSMLGAFRRGGQTTLSVVPALVDRLRAATGSDAAYCALHAMLERAAAAAASDAASAGVCTSLYHRGALLVRLTPPESADELAPACFALPAEQDYWEPHVDKHNAAQYDVSAVLYLSTQGEQFEGGDFRFHDQGGDVSVAPRAGHLLTFSSGGENPHSAGRVFKGARFALACWFTASPAHAVQLPPPAASGSTAAPLGGPPTAPLPPTAPPPPPLPLWSSDRALTSAAECCLASNDALRDALMEAHAYGRPVLRALREEALSATGVGGRPLEPSGWLARVGGGREGEAGEGEGGEGKGTQREGGLAGEALCGGARKRPIDPSAEDGVESPRLPHQQHGGEVINAHRLEADASATQRLLALQAAVSAREKAVEQARRVKVATLSSATAAGTTSSDFDCFG
jgi:hypothetical protein